ncbi:MAG: TIGR00341 family protein [Gammaproteobacteria bacterium]
MNAIMLLYDPAQEATVRQAILPMLAGRQVTDMAYVESALPTVETDATLVTYLGDAELASLIPAALTRHWRIGLLPHPGMLHARLGFGIAASLEDAIADILKTDDAVEVDLPHCNGRPFFNAVVIGDSFTLTPGSAETEGLWARARRFTRLISGLRTMTLRPFKLTTHKGKTLDTAALGIVAVEHGRSSAISRRIIGDSAASDGMLHALVLAPRSVMEITRFLATSLFLRGRDTENRLPDFVGHIKTESLTITGSKAVGYTVDGVPGSAQEFVLTVAARALTLIPGRHLHAEHGAEDAKESFRVQGLPTDAAMRELASRPLPLVHSADTEEFKELFLLLRENSRASETYLILMALSTLLATIGLFANSIPVIIGAMILAPLMSPIISLSMGVLRQQEDLMIGSAKSIALGVLLALACTTLLTWITPLHTINSEIAARLSPTLLDMGVAIISGIAGAYAHARSEIARSLAGVAIAVALIPPLAVSGIGIGWGEWAVFQGAFLLFLTNLSGIVLAAALTFLALGYSPYNRAKRGLALSLVLVGIVSVPLAFGFHRMVSEHRIIQALEGREAAGVLIRDVRIRSGTPLYLSVRLLSDAPFDGARIDTVKDDIERILQRDIVLEASVALVR